MSQNWNFMKNFKFDFLRIRRTLNSKSMWFQHYWVLDFRDLSITFWCLSSSWIFWDFNRVTCILYHHTEFQRNRSTTKIFISISIIFWFWMKIFAMSLELQWWEIDPWSLEQKWCLWIVVLLWAIKWLIFFRCLRVKKNCLLMKIPVFLFFWSHSSNPWMNWKISKQFNLCLTVDIGQNP